MPKIWVATEKLIRYFISIEEFKEVTQKNNRYGREIHRHPLGSERTDRL